MTFVSVKERVMRHFMPAIAAGFAVALLAGPVPRLRRHRTRKTRS
jgi:hypothetical protein